MGDDARAEYWREALEYAFDGLGLYDVIEALTAEQRTKIGASLATSAEHQGMAFYTPEAPIIRETDTLRRKLKWERERVGCKSCGGRGRVEFSAGPWWCNTHCDTCDGSGKVHPCNEREPA